MVAAPDPPDRLRNSQTLGQMNGPEHVSGGTALIVSLGIGRQRLRIASI